MSWADGLPSRFREEEATETLSWGLFGCSPHQLNRSQREAMRHWRDDHIEWTPGDPININDTKDGAR